MNNTYGINSGLQVVFNAEQIGERVRELGRQITKDYQQGVLCVVVVIENGFVFAADLIRAIERPLLCQFIRSDFTKQGDSTEIFFSPEQMVEGFDVLLVEGVVQSGVTTEFLIRNLQTRGAKSVKLAALIDRQKDRQVALHPDYAGFIFDGPKVVGYGLGSWQFGRNMPYIAALQPDAAAAGS